MIKTEKTQEKVVLVGVESQLLNKTLTRTPFRQLNLLSTIP